MTTRRKQNKLTGKYVSLSAAAPKDEPMPQLSALLPQLSPDAQRIMDLTMELSSKVNNFQIDLGVAVGILNEEKNHVEKHMNRLRAYFDDEKTTLLEQQEEQLRHLEDLKNSTLNFCASMHTMLCTLHEKFSSRKDQETTNVTNGE